MPQSVNVDRSPPVVNLGDSSRGKVAVQTFHQLLWNTE
jgi:hypothetical protein